jgi:hypothetical protein
MVYGVSQAEIKPRDLTWLARLVGRNQLDTFCMVYGVSLQEMAG